MSNLGEPKEVSTSEKDGKDALDDVKRVRDVLLNSRRPTRAIGNGDLLPEVRTVVIVIRL